MTKRTIKTLNFNLVCGIPSLGEPYKLVTTHVSNFGEGLFLFVAHDTEDDVHGRSNAGEGFGVFPKTKMAKSKNFKLVIVRENRQEVIDLGLLNFTFPMMDIFDDGRVVIVASRSQWRGTDDFDLNGMIVDPKSSEKTKFLAGDGVEALSVNAQNQIIISYFDEGVFGNFGWGHPGPAGPGAGGLNYFDDKGQIIWKFNDSGHFIDDCYALNVAGEDTYAYYYSDFSICKIDKSFKRTVWKTHLSGCHAVAVQDDTVLFSGQYDDGPEIFYVAKMLKKRISKPRKIKAKLKFGKITRGRQTFARRHEVHHFNQTGWFRASIESLRDDYDPT